MLFAGISIPWILAAIVVAWLLRFLLGRIKELAASEQVLGPPRPEAVEPYPPAIQRESDRVPGVATRAGWPEARAGDVVAYSPAAISSQLRDPASLRKAFILREILEPPLTLRAEEEPRF